MARLRLTKDYGSYKKGNIVELRASEAKQLLKAKVATVQTDMGSDSFVTKRSKK